MSTKSKTTFAELFGPESKFASDNNDIISQDLIKLFALCDMPVVAFFEMKLTITGAKKHLEGKGLHPILFLLGAIIDEKAKFAISQKTINNLQLIPGMVMPHVNEHIPNPHQFRPR